MGKAATLLIFAFVALAWTAIEVRGQANNLAMQQALNSANSQGRLGQPNLSVLGGGSWNNSRNFHVGGNVGVDTKVFESKNQRHSIGVAVNAGQSYGRNQGMHWKILALVSAIATTLAVADVVKSN